VVKHGGVGIGEGWGPAAAGARACGGGAGWLAVDCTRRV
jgi:hypothetical protein